MYKVTNKLECPVRLGKILFGPGETKILKEAPTSDKFTVEKTEKEEEPTEKKKKGGKQ